VVPRLPRSRGMFPQLSRSLVLMHSSLIPDRHPTSLQQMRRLVRPSAYLSLRCSRLPPYHSSDTNHAILYEKITRGPRYIRWPAFSANTTDLTLKLMEGDPSKRDGNLHHEAGDVFAHVWFREVDWDKLRDREITAPYLPKIQGDGDASA
jgi:serine/threonine protein kinase